MNIEARINDDYKMAMRSRDSDRVACIRQLKSKVQEAVNSSNFTGEVDDALYEKTIASYVKSLQKGIEELGAAGDRGAALRGKYNAEITYLKTFLPALLDADQTRALVKQQIAALGISSSKEIGKLMGALMKGHKGKIDAGLVKQIAAEELPGA